MVVCSDASSGRSSDVSKFSSNEYWNEEKRELYSDFRDLITEIRLDSNCCASGGCKHFHLSSSFGRDGTKQSIQYIWNIISTYLTAAHHSLDPPVCPPTMAPKSPK